MNILNVLVFGSVGILWGNWMGNLFEYLAIGLFGNLSSLLFEYLGIWPSDHLTIRLLE